MNLAEKLRKIRLIICDVDGVLTDGVMYRTEGGQQLKAFDSHDGLGLVAAQKVGLKVALLSGKKSAIVSERAAELGIKLVLQGVEDKEVALLDLAEQAGVPAEEAVYVGDDLNDLPALRAAGLAVAVASAAEEVKQAADLVTQRPGGRGAVREVVETILKAQGLWHQVLESYQGQKEE